MGALRRYGPRIAITLLPMLLALVHASGLWRWDALQRLDDFIYDTRLVATLPHSVDPRIVIVDIDEESLQTFSQWPWSRGTLARLTDELLVRQQAAVLGFDMVFAEPDRRAASAEPDEQFAHALAGGKVALGYYLTRTGTAQARGVLPEPTFPASALPVAQSHATRWTGYGANIPVLAEAASAAGFINADIDAADDGVLRSVPLIAYYEGSDAPGYYESLGLTIYRLASNTAAVAPVLGGGQRSGSRILEALSVGEGAARIRVPVDHRARLLIPFRGLGGPLGGSFRYIPVSRVLQGGLAPGELKDKIVLVGTSAPGLQDLRSTPVSATFPGVEVHASVVSALLDERFLWAPADAGGYEVIVLLAAGLALAFGLSLLSVPQALLLAISVVGALVGLDTWLYLQAGLVLPLASALVMCGFAIVINMSWSGFVEARTRRRLAALFGTYVPPELVDKMMKRPGRYTMRAESKEMTVMFCDIRGFTELSERMAPIELQALLNKVFNRLTEIISRHSGTVDKYMGDCVMAFWGAPVDVPEHASQAVQAALEMVRAMRRLNVQNLAAGRPEIEIGIGLNTGIMSVGDMGSRVRRSYTVIGDSVNLAARIEGLGQNYGASIVATAATVEQVPSQAWQEVDRVRVKGKAQAVAIFMPLPFGPKSFVVLERWNRVLLAYRAQEFETAQALLSPLLAQDAKNVLYQVYAQRIALMRLHPPGSDWDGATQYETK